MTAYDSGEFAKSAEFYQSELNPSYPSAAVLYNSGNCLYQQGKVGEALVAYERARRLAPRDSSIIENLNFLRRKLFIPEYGKVSNPLDFLITARNMLRMDQWILISSILWFLIFLILSFKKKKSPSYLYPLTVFITAFIITVFAAFSEDYSEYSSDEAVVISVNAPVYSLPSKKTGKIIFKLRSGECLELEEKRRNWRRIRTENTDGWIHEDDINRIWPPSN